MCIRDREYTDEYSYIKSISDNLNSLLKSYEKESTYINENRDNLDSTKYKAILLSLIHILEIHYLKQKLM